MNRREFFRAVGLGGAALAAPSLLVRGAPAGEAPPRKPNIVLILADDLGYECIGAHGGTSYKTPVLDRLAATGMRFDRCYVQPLCTPTRVQLMTGIYNVRNYTHFGHMDPGQTTFAHLLKKAGYATCIAGKWQLGQAPDLPARFGFDEYCLWQHTRRPPRYVNPGLEIMGKEMDYTHGEYGPDLVNAYALDFVKRKKDGPFFLYYPMILTHAPYMATPDSADWDPKLTSEKGGSAAHFADMVAYMDKLIGRLAARLDELGLRQNTLILFLGDNGTGAGTQSQMGDRTVVGGKGKGTDAGMHVPLIANWPGVVPPGKACGDLVDSTDFLPTICQAAGAQVPGELAIDGRSFLAQLRGQKGDPRPWIYCWFSREGGPKAQVELAANERYKLYADGRMFDLTKDLPEKAPLAAGALDAEASAARKVLQAALDKYKGARPPQFAGRSGPGGGDEAPAAPKKATQTSVPAAKVKGGKKSK